MCRIKQCTRGAAHLACVNFRPSSASALSILRSNYCCPRHSVAEVTTLIVNCFVEIILKLSQDVESIVEDVEESPEEGAGGDDRARSGRKAACKCFLLLWIKMQFNGFLFHYQAMPRTPIF